MAKTAKKGKVFRLESVPNRVGGGKEETVMVWCSGGCDNRVETLYDEFGQPYPAACPDCKAAYDRLYDEC